jgi:WD40 repeat protein
VSPGGRRVFVTGTSQGRNSGADYATVAYDAATGKQLWVRRYNGRANRNDFAGSMAVSPDGHRVFVTGSSRGRSSGYDYATVAYAAGTGALLWVKRYNGHASRDDNASSVAVSPDGHRILVTGTSLGRTSHHDFATVAYGAATGAPLWVRRYNGSANLDDYGEVVLVSPRGGGTVVVAGTSRGQNPDFAAVAYSTATGANKWGSRFTGAFPRGSLARGGAQPGRPQRLPHRVRGGIRGRR